eukprot:403338554
MNDQKQERENNDLTEQKFQEQQQNHTHAPQKQQEQLQQESNINQTTNITNLYVINDAQFEFKFSSQGHSIIDVSKTNQQLTSNATINQSANHLTIKQANPAATNSPQQTQNKQLQMNQSSNQKQSQGQAANGGNIGVLGQKKMLSLGLKNRKQMVSKTSSLNPTSTVINVQGSNGNNSTPQKHSNESLLISACVTSDKKATSVSDGTSQRNSNIKISSLVSDHKSSTLQIQNNTLVKLSNSNKKTVQTQINSTTSSQGQSTQQNSEEDQKRVKYERTNKALKQTKKEIESSCDKILSFFINSVIIKCIRLAVYFSYAIIFFCSIPLQILYCSVEIMFGSCFRGNNSRDMEQRKAQGKCIKCRSNRKTVQTQWERQQQRKLQFMIDDEDKETLTQQRKQTICKQNQDCLEDQQTQQSSCNTNCSSSNFDKMRFTHTNKRLIVVLDLDNTLIHSVNSVPTSSDQNYFAIRDNIYVYKRPHMEYFLAEIAKFADIYIFTASMKDYADQIMDVIDPKKTFGKCFYRTDCKKDERRQIYKDLSTVSDDLTQLIMIDDNEINCTKNPLNTFKIKHWTKSMRDDTCLKSCLSLIKYLRYSENIQIELPNVLQMNEEWMPSDL